MTTRPEVADKPTDEVRATGHTTDAGNAIRHAHLDLPTDPEPGFVLEAIPPPTPGQVLLWTVDIRGSERAALLADTILDDQEQRRARRFHHHHSQQRYTVAHLALRLLLGACLDSHPAAIRLVREACHTCGAAHGRPVVEGSGVSFSLSHSGEHALIAIAANPVGVDIQAIPQRAAALRVARALHPLEAAELAMLPPHEMTTAFTRAWTRKEAFLKAIGTGLSRGTEVDYVGTGPTPAPGPDGWTIRDLHAPPGCRAALASRR